MTISDLGIAMVQWIPADMTLLESGIEIGNWGQYKFKICPAFQRIFFEFVQVSIPDLNSRFPIPGGSCLREAAVYGFIFYFVSWHLNLVTPDGPPLMKYINIYHY